MRTLILAALPLLALAACKGEAAKDTAPNASQSAGPAAAAPPPMQGDPSKNPDMTGFASEVDTNGDGRMSAAEWQARGLPQSSFGMFEKGRGYVTLEDYQKNAAPGGIDLNGDGKLTVAEMKEFDKRMSAKMAGQGGPPPPPPQPSSHP